MATSVETSMRELDAIWCEQQHLLPSLTLSTKAPSSVTNKFVQEHLDDCGSLRFQHDPQAVARDAQVWSLAVYEFVSACNQQILVPPPCIAIPL